MIELDCMELGDCFTPKQLVDEIYRQCPELTYPIPVKAIAKAVGVEAIVPMSSEEVEGMLVADDTKSVGVISYKESSPLGRQRFTIGHELGHFLLLHHGAEQNCAPKDIRFVSSSDSLIQLESEANQFSQLLLMPDTLISESINEGIPDIELLKSISEGFQMSFEAMANRCACLSERPFALIYSKDGVVRYCWQDWRVFPYKISLKKGDAIPKVSYAKAALKGPEDTISDVVKADPHAWLGDNFNDKSLGILTEQTYTQQKGYQITMIKAGG